MESFHHEGPEHRVPNNEYRTPSTEHPAPSSLLPHPSPMTMIPDSIDTDHFLMSLEDGLCRIILSVQTDLPINGICNLHPPRQHQGQTLANTHVNLSPNTFWRSSPIPEKGPRKPARVLVPSVPKWETGSGPLRLSHRISNPLLEPKKVPPGSAFVSGRGW